MRGGIAVLVGLLGLALAAQAVPLCDYRSSLTDLSDLMMSFSYEYVNDPYGAKERDVNAGRFVVDYKRLYDTAEYGFDVGVANQLDISLLDVSSYSTVADGNYKRYLTSDGDAFAFAGASVRSSSSYSSLGVSVDLGLGLGRFNDVTPLAIATRIDEDLVRRGRLTDHLRAADLQILAYEIGSRQTYLSLGDLLSVVQEIIESSGFVRPGGLDALDLSKITDLLKDSSFTRYCGWDGKLGVGYEILDPSGGTNDLLVTAAFNYAFTTAPNAQFLVSGSLSGPPDLFTTNRVDVNAEYDAIVSEFLNAKATYAFSRETHAGAPTDVHRISFDLVLTPLDTANVTLTMSFEHKPHYLEWSVDIRLGMSIQLL
ncbi:MAG: hypothetical protein NTX23_02310 [Candidatus Bipolaricaulota bacterium]|nr:hypothetical protein [Candidatus Bipolaricaulota bacterium]